VTFDVHERTDGKWVAHALDFDLLAVSGTKEKAVDKVRLATKMYIEFGLMNNWADDIIFPAPNEYWERLTGKCITLLPPIEIEDKRLLVYEAFMAHEHRQVAETA